MIERHDDVEEMIERHDDVEEMVEERLVDRKTRLGRGDDRREFS